MLRIRSLLEIPLFTDSMFQPAHETRDWLQQHRIDQRCKQRRGGIIAERTRHVGRIGHFGNQAYMVSVLMRLVLNLLVLPDSWVGIRSKADKLRSSVHAGN